MLCLKALFFPCINLRMVVSPEQPLLRFEYVSRRFAIGAADVMGKASAWASFLVARSSRRTPPGDYPLS